jgi:uncharacterized protein (DUF924 family)
MSSLDHEKLEKIDARAKDVLVFWFEQATLQQWFAKDPDFDQKINDSFRLTWRDARAGELDHWQDHPLSCLALVIVLDQFSRNMFRDRPDAFASDDQALSVCHVALGKMMDMELNVTQRHFIYMPLMHSEKFSDQEMSVDLAQKRLGDDVDMSFAIEHRDVIARFGRFPHRNPILGREMTAEEQAFLDETGWSP